MHVAVLGAGTTGTHAARTIRQLRPDAAITLVDRDARKAISLADSLGAHAGAAPSLRSVPGDVTAALLCAPALQHESLARAALELGVDVVSLGDSIEDVQALLALDARARDAGRTVIVGAGFSPGLSCVLARHAAALLDEIEEIYVARSGTGGPACARQHHRALKAQNWEWRGAEWIRRRGSSGRRLVWFPDLIGALDCYRAGLAEPFLLQRSQPGSHRIVARMAATRRDRLTGWLPMLRPPHADGGPGGLRVEVWGRRQGNAELVVYGVADNPSLVAAMVAAVTVDAVDRGVVSRRGSFGLSEVIDPIVVLDAVTSLGLTISAFEGAA